MNRNGMKMETGVVTGKKLGKGFGRGFAPIWLSLLFAAATPAFADSGTQDQQDACRPDVRRFCHQIRPDAGDGAFLSCLQANRPRLSVGCRGVLESHGV